MCCCNILHTLLGIIIIHHVSISYNMYLYHTYPMTYYIYNMCLNNNIIIRDIETETMHINYHSIYITYEDNI